MKRILQLAAVILIASCGAKQEKPSLEGKWIEVVPEGAEYTQGITLNEDGTASSIGMETLKYESWATDDNTLILNGKSIGNGQTIEFSDTLKIIKLTNDSLTLERNNGYRCSYHR